MPTTSIKRFGFIQQLRNSVCDGQRGRCTNQMARMLKDEGYGKLYQQNMADCVVLNGTNKEGGTKTLLLEPFGIKSKRVDVERCEDGRIRKTIDKSFCNEYGGEYAGSTTVVEMDGSKLLSKTVEKRGWNA